MKYFKHLLFTLIVQCSFIYSLMAQPEAENSGTSQTQNKIESQLTKLSWLVGHWIGDGWGGISEEVWASPVDGAMMGMYRHIKDDKVNFYEFMNIVEKEGKIEMRIKHFAADFKGWEEKDDYIVFPFIKADENYFEFDGLIFHKLSEKDMQITVTLGDKEGNTRTEVFTFTRRSTEL